MADTGLETNGNGHETDPPAVSSGDASRQQSDQSDKLESSAQPPAVHDVIYSDIGLTTLLERLKQSIASARDFAVFLKKRSTAEEDHAKALKRLAKVTQDSLHHADVRAGSYSRQMADTMRTHDRMADNGMQFALSLHQMHEDLNELTRNMELGRKAWKHQGLDAEKRATDAESLMARAKNKYDGLADDYDRAKTGDIKGSRKLIRGPKSAAQYEEDVFRKLQLADTDYQDKVSAAKAQRQELLTTDRPKAVKAVQELIRECDSAVVLQLQKFATFNEKLLLGNGMLVTPLPTEGASNRSMRDIVADIDNEKDFNDHVSSFRSKVPPKAAEIQYVRHPTLATKQNAPPPINISATQPQSRQPSGNYPQSGPPTSSGSTFKGPGSDDRSFGTGPPSAIQSGSFTGGGLASAPLPIGSGPPSASYTGSAPPSAPFPPSAPYSPAHGPSTQNYSHTRNVSQNAQLPPLPQSPAYNSAAPYPTAGEALSSAPPIPAKNQDHFAAGPMSAPAPPYNVTPQKQVRPDSRDNQGARSPAPIRPVFGVDLEQLFQRDGSAVPMVVYQCMQAVDLFGLSLEGIYRQNGTAAHIQELKRLFDNDASKVDFRNPAGFHQDVNSVAGLLKQFFRDLPDPLLTNKRYGEFISAARIEDEIIRRDTLHAIINDMPDANYATLRALVLHLNRVKDHQGQNRMTSSNLAICFAPSLMGSSGSMQIQDSALQARVIDTILQNTYQIFDED